jgi:hypothetical protein
MLICRQEAYLVRRVFENRRSVVICLVLGALFAAAYGQWPLYSSNQHTYFLRGIARAEGGALQNDWLVGCKDNVPLFSAYVFVVVKWLSPLVFYFVHAFLVTVYAVCLIWLIGRALHISVFDPALLISVVLLTVVHSDLAVTLLNKVDLPLMRLVARLFQSMSEGVAGQPMLRHFHQPSAFGVFLLGSFCGFLAGRRRLAVVLAGIAVWWHAIYLLPAILLIPVYAIVEWRERGRISGLLTGLVGLFVLFPVVLYAWVNFHPTSPAAFAEANRILVHERFPHHADPATWFGLSTVFQIALVIAGLVIIRKDRSFLMLFAYLFAVASTLTVVQILTESDALAMLLPWRLFVLLVPVSASLALAFIVRWILARLPWTLARRRGTTLVCLGLMALLGAAGILTTVVGTRAPRYPADLVAYVSERCNRDHTYLVPIEWEWFRLATGCPVFVDLKSHPYKDTEVIEWHRRIKAARSFYAASNPTEQARLLAGIAQGWGVTHLVTSGATGSAEIPGCVLEAEGSDWTVCRITPEARASTRQGQP